jgi:hypothetical protein
VLDGRETLETQTAAGKDASRPGTHGIDAHGRS